MSTFEVMENFEVKHFLERDFNIHRIMNGKMQKRKKLKQVTSENNENHFHFRVFSK